MTTTLGPQGPITGPAIASVAPARLPKATQTLLVTTVALLPVKLGSGGPLAPADITMVLAYTSLLPRMVRLPKTARYPCLLLLGAMTAACFVTFFGSDAYAARWGATRLIGFVLLLAYLVVFHHAFTRRPQFALRCLRVFVTSTLAVNALLLPKMPTRALLATVFHQKWDSRLSGALYDPNANGALLAVCLLLVVFGPRQLAPRGIGRTVTSIALAACLAWTFSRGAAVGAAVGLAYGGFVVLRRRPRVLLGVLVAFAIGATVVVAAGLPAIVERRYEARPESSLNNRVGYVEQSIDAFERSPFVGSGLGHGTSTDGAVTHATFFWLLGDAGALAALAYLWLLVAAVRAARRAGPRLRLPLVACLLCLTVTSFSFESLYQRPLWLILALAFAVAATPDPSRNLA